MSLFGPTRLLGTLTTGLVFASCVGSSRSAPTVAPSPVADVPAAKVLRAARDDSTLWMEMRNVDLRVNAQQFLRVRTLRGQVVTKPGVIAWLDDPASFTIHATSGQVALDGDAITALLNEHAFNYPGVPIKNLRVRIEDGKLVQKGTLHKGVDIPFEMWSVPALDSSGKLRLHPDKLRIFGVNGIALMHALGLHLDNMMDLSKSRGASVDEDDILIDPLKILPPPAVAGRLQGVRVEGPLLVQDFARTADDTIFGTFVKPDSDAKNFIYFRGGMLRFGKLTMTDTDLLINDADDRDPFDLYFAKYNAQLAAGRTKNLLNFGVRTWMVDFGKLSPAAQSLAASPPR